MPRHRSQSASSAMSSSAAPGGGEGSAVASVLRGVRQRNLLPGVRVEVFLGAPSSLDIPWLRCASGGGGANPSETLRSKSR